MNLLRVKIIDKHIWKWIEKNTFFIQEVSYYTFFLTHKEQQEDGDEHIEINVRVSRNTGGDFWSENLLPSVVKRLIMEKKDPIHWKYLHTKIV